MTRGRAWCVTGRGKGKFNLDTITRDDICALTPAAAQMSGIKHVMDLDREEAERIMTMVE